MQDSTCKTKKEKERAGASRGEKPHHRRFLGSLSPFRFRHSPLLFCQRPPLFRAGRGKAACTATVDDKTRKRDCDLTVRLKREAGAGSRGI